MDEVTMEELAVAMASGDPEKIEDVMIRVYREKVSPMILDFVSRDLSEATQEDVKSIIMSQHEFTTSLIDILDVKR